MPDQGHQWHSFVSSKSGGFENSGKFAVRVCRVVREWVHATSEETDGSPLAGERCSSCAILRATTIIIQRYSLSDSAGVSSKRSGCHNQYLKFSRLIEWKLEGLVRHMKGGDVHLNTPTSPGYSDRTTDSTHTQHRTGTSIPLKSQAIWFTSATVFTPLRLRH